MVLSWNEKTGEREYKEVTELFLHEVELLYEVRIQRPHDGSLTSLVDETILETTWNHPFWVVDKEGWIEVKDLKVGDRVLLSDGKEVAISGIRSYNVEATKVYNFEVADSHTYFVGEDGVLVHNYDVKTGTVEKGDTLSSIALELKKAGMGNYSWKELAVMNGMDIDGTMDPDLMHVSIFPDDKIITTEHWQNMSDDEKDAYLLKNPSHDVLRKKVGANAYLAGHDEGEIAAYERIIRRGSFQKHISYVSSGTTPTISTSDIASVGIGHGVIHNAEKTVFSNNNSRITTVEINAGSFGIGFYLDQSNTSVGLNWSYNLSLGKKFGIKASQGNLDLKQTSSEYKYYKPHKRWTTPKVNYGTERVDEKFDWLRK